MQDDDDPLIPVADCPICEEATPVVVSNVEHLWEEIGELVYCPVCENIINLVGDIALDYYTVEELAKLGWKRID